MSTGDILLDYHPIMIARAIKSAVGNLHQRQIARTLGCTQQYVSLLLSGIRPLTPKIAVKLEAFGLDGRDLYAKQARRSVEIEWRYEHGIIERPSILISREAGEKMKRAKVQNKSVLRENAVKAARTRKRMAALRASEAAKGEEKGEAA